VSKAAVRSVVSKADVRSVLSKADVRSVGSKAAVYGVLSETLCTEYCTEDAPERRADAHSVLSKTAVY
jgi:hypothetical protein